MLSTRNKQILLKVLPLSLLIHEVTEYHDKLYTVTGMAADGPSRLYHKNIWFHDLREDSVVAGATATTCRPTAAQGRMLDDLLPAHKEINDRLTRAEAAFSYMFRVCRTAADVRVALPPEILSRLSALGIMADVNEFFAGDSSLDRSDKTKLAKAPAFAFVAEEMLAQKLEGL